MKPLATNEQKILIHNILQSRGLLDEKKYYVRKYSNNRCESSTELYFEEAEALIGFFQPKRTKKVVKIESEKAIRLRKNIFGSMVELSEKLNFIDYFYKGNWNMPKISQFFVEQTGKDNIYQMNEAERLKIYVALQSKISGMKKEAKKKELKALENEFEYNINND